MSKDDLDRLFAMEARAEKAEAERDAAVQSEARVREAAKHIKSLTTSMSSAKYEMIDKVAGEILDSPPSGDAGKEGTKV